MKLSIASGVATESAEGERRWDISAFAAECRAADQLGFFGVYTGERRSFGGAMGRTAVTSNPALLSGYGLSLTDNVVFGSHVALMPLHHPVSLVQEASVLNTLYPGRYQLGVGAGYSAEDFATFGIPLSERGRRMEAGLRTIRAYLDGADGDVAEPWSGRLPDQDGVTRQAALKLLVGAWSEPGVRRAADFADGWLTGPVRTVTEEARLAAIYRARCAVSGRTPRVVLMRDAAIAPSDQEAEARFGSYLLDYHRIYFDRGGLYEARFDPWVQEVGSSREMTLETVGRDRFLYGSPDRWIQTIRQWREKIDPDEIILRIRFYVGPAIEDVLEQLDLIGREVIPYV